MQMNCWKSCRERSGGSWIDSGAMFMRLQTMIVHMRATELVERDTRNGAKLPRGFEFKGGIEYLPSDHVIDGHIFVFQ